MKQSISQTSPRKGPGDRALHPDLLISEVLQTWPGTAEVFVRHRMACVGCPVSDFETLAEAADACHIAPRALLAALRACIGSGRAARRGRKHKTRSRRLP